MLTLKVKKLDPQAKVPTKNHINDAAFDLYSLETVELFSAQATKIKTGIAVEIPDGYYGQIFDRSSLGSKGISVLGGVIDGGYRGEIIVCLLNTNLRMETDGMGVLTGETFYANYKIEKGDKVAQMVILPVPQMEVIEVDELGESDRGEKGFGSSGK